MYYGKYIMKRFICIIIGIAILSGMTSCTKIANHKEEYLLPPTHFQLSDSDLKTAEKKALEGDVKSAFKIYQHYSFGKFDSISSFPWLQIAANGGHVVAQYNLGYIYMNSGLFKNIYLARFWLEEAKKNGSTEATGLLKELERAESKNN